MRPPIIAAVSGDLLLFHKAEGLESELEAIDISNGEYRFYDADGQVLDPDIDAEERIRLRPSEPPKREPEILAGLICGFLNRVDQDRSQLSPAVIQAMSLDQLVIELERISSQAPPRRTSWKQRLRWYFPFLFRKSSG